MLSFTTGGMESMYLPDGINGDINVLLWPLQVKSIARVDTDLNSEFLAAETLNNEHILCRMEFCASVGFRFWPRRSSGVLHTLLPMRERLCCWGGRPGFRGSWMKSRCLSLALSFLTWTSRQGSDSGQRWRRSTPLNHTAWPQHTTWGKRFLQTTRPRLNKEPPEPSD